MADLIGQLRNIVGAGHVHDHAENLDRYETEPMGKYKSRVAAVVCPSSTAEVAAIMRLAQDTGTPVVPVGGNTGLAGGTYAGDDGTSIMLSLERMNRIREIRPNARLAVVEAGVVLANLHSAVAEHDLTFPLIFGARGSCMIGGNLSTNAGGSNVVRYGNTRDLCLGIEVVTPQGEVLDLMNELHKDNTGYSLKNLYIGSEGTLGVITAAVLKLSPRPKVYATAMVGVASVDAALGLLQELRSATNNAVEAFEYMPARYFETYAMLYPDDRAPFETPQAHAVLVEIGATGDRDAAPHPDGGTVISNLLESVLARRFEDGSVTDAVIAQNERERTEMWERRERAFEVSQAKGSSIRTDVSVALDRVGPYIAEVERRVLAAYPQADILVISHLGDGNLHHSIWLHAATRGTPTKAENEGVTSIVEDVTREMGGSFSAEHGIGVYKLGSMARRKDAPSVEVMRAIKAALDPKGILNPGKVIPGASR